MVSLQAPPPLGRSPRRPGICSSPAANLAADRSSNFSDSLPLLAQEVLFVGSHMNSLALGGNGAGDCASVQRSTPSARNLLPRS